MVCPEEMEPDLRVELAPGQAEEWEKGGVKAAGGVQALLANVSALRVVRLFRIRLEFPVPRWSVLSAEPQ